MAISGDSPEWCDGFVARELVILTAAAAVGVFALAFSVIGMRRSWLMGCVEFSRCPCRRTGGGYNTVEPMSKDSPRDRGSNDDVPLDALGPSDVSWTAAAGKATRPAILNVDWKSYFFLFLRMGAVVTISLEPWNRRASGNTAMLILIIASVQTAVDSATQLTSTFRAADTRARRFYFGFGMFGLVVGMACIGITIAQTQQESTIGREQWLTYLVVVAVVFVVLVASCIMLYASFNATRNATAQRVAIALSFVLSMASAAVTVYGATLSVDERETTARQKGCFGDLSAYGADFVIFTARVLYIVSGILLLLFSVPAACGEDDVSKAQRASPTVSPDSSSRPSARSVF